MIKAKTNSLDFNQHRFLLAVPAIKSRSSPAAQTCAMHLHRSAMDLEVPTGQSRSPEYDSKVRNRSPSSRPLPIQTNPPWAPALVLRAARACDVETEAAASSSQAVPRATGDRESSWTAAFVRSGSDGVGEERVKPCFL